MVMVYKDQIDQVEVVMLPGSLNVRLHIDLKFFINTEFIIDEIHIYIYIYYMYSEFHVNYFTIFTLITTLSTDVTKSLQCKGIFLSDAT